MSPRRELWFCLWLHTHKQSLDRLSRKSLALASVLNADAQSSVAHIGRLGLK